MAVKKLFVIKRNWKFYKLKYWNSIAWQVVNITFSELIAMIIGLFNKIHMMHFKFI